MQKCNLFLQMSGAQVSLKKRGDRHVVAIWLFSPVIRVMHIWHTKMGSSSSSTLARSLSKIPRCSALSRKLVLVVVCICVHEVYPTTFCKSDPPCYLLIRCLCPQLCNLFLTLRIDEVYESATTLSGEMENISKISALLHFFFTSQK